MNRERGIHINEAYTDVWNKNGAYISDATDSPDEVIDIFHK